jgi:hypothetical protein
VPSGLMIEYVGKSKLKYAICLELQVIIIFVNGELNGIGSPHNVQSEHIKP